MTVTFKKGVPKWTLRAPMREAVKVLDVIHQELTGRDLVVTSTTDGKHRVERSAHYRGDAADVRTWHTEEEQNTEEFAELARTALGSDYVVVVEPTHMHVHWSPMYNGASE